MAKDKQEIILGACDIFMYEYKGDPKTDLPEHGTVESDEHNVGHCSGGFSVSYKPTKYEVKNQYGTTVKGFITKEEVSVKTGILSWDLNNIALLSTAVLAESEADGVKIRKLTFSGKGQALKNVLVRAVHTKEDGKKIRFTMIGSGGNGFDMEFGEKELTVDAEISAITYKTGFLAEFEEEM